MTESAQFTQIQDLSTALASLVASTAPSVLAVQSHRSRSSGVLAGTGHSRFQIQPLPFGTTSAVS
jgi:hypothetical protein